MFGLIALGLTALSGAASAYTQYQAGKQQQYNHDYNAKVAENEAEQRALEGRENVRRMRENADRQLSAARARMAGQGGVQNAGSPLAVLGEVAGQLDLEIQDEWYAANSQRSALLQRSALERMRGKNAKNSAKLLAGSTLLNTATNVSHGLYNANKTKPEGTSLFKHLSTF